jgi:hypothetical protein
LCLIVIDAATKIVTGGGPVVEKAEENLNATAELKKKAQPKAIIPVVPKKRKVSAKKLNFEKTGPSK